MRLGVFSALLLFLHSNPWHRNNDEKKTENILSSLPRGTWDEAGGRWEKEGLHCRPAHANISRSG